MTINSVCVFCGARDGTDPQYVLSISYSSFASSFEVITWKQLNTHKKPIILFNQDGYWDKFVALTENIIGHGFANESVRSLYTVVDSIEGIFNALGK